MLCLTVIMDISKCLLFKETSLLKFIPITSIVILFDLRTLKLKVVRSSKTSVPYLFTPWSRMLPKNVTGSQLVKKFPAFYGTRTFITAFTSARHLSLS